MLPFELVDYREFHLNKINLPQYAHVKLLLYWPLFGLAFLTLERLWIRSNYTPIYCTLDDIIPFCEYFLFAYLFWFIFLVGIFVYGFFFDVPTFRRAMYFTIISYTLTILLYILFPNCQELRPETFLRDNMLTRFMAGFYQFDTNTNVCPSLHVIGSIAVLYGAWYSKHFSSRTWRIIFTLTALLISISTVFLKQHSILDVLAAVPVCLIAWLGANKYFARKECCTASLT